MVKVLPGPAAGPPADPEIATLEMQLAAAIEQKRSHNKVALIGLGLLLLASLGVGLVNWGMERFKHDERIACMQLKRLHPDVDCGTKLELFTQQAEPTQKSAQATPEAVESSFTRTLVLDEKNTEMRFKPGEHVKFCMQRKGGGNIFPNDNIVVVVKGIPQPPIIVGTDGLQAGIPIAEGQCFLAGERP